MNSSNLRKMIWLLEKQDIWLKGVGSTST